MNAIPSVLAYSDPIGLPRGSGFFSDPEAVEIVETSRSLEERLIAAAAGTVVSLYLGSQKLTASCLAALLTPALLLIANGRAENRFLLLVDPEERNTWDADAALRKQSSLAGEKLACVCRGANDVSLVGPVDEQIAATYWFVARNAAARQGVTSRDLAVAEGISIQAASNRFAKTATQGLICRASRENVAGGGVQHVFVPVQ